MKKPLFRHPRIGAALAAAWLPFTPATAQTVAAAANTDSQRIVITGNAERDAYAARDSDSATGLGLTLRETPQSLSVITRQVMDDFKLTSVNDVLSLATGIVVEQPETDRSYYTARGFDIVNFQVDGIGIPFSYGIVDGDLDTAIYERIDVIRGAAGLLVGTGNPSATINFVRRRPTRRLQGSVGLSLGSWNDRRVDVDVGGPLNASGSVRGRFVAAAQDRDSYLDRYHHRKGVFSAIVEADVGDSTLLTVGHTRQENRPQAPLWGALPLYFSDGTPTDLPVSTSTSVDWARWASGTDISFAEVSQQLGGGWSAKAQYTHKEVRGRGKMLYVYGTPDRDTGLGLYAWPSIYDLNNRQDIVDLRAAGPVTLGGRRHELVAGLSASDSRLHDHSIFGDSLYAPLPSLYTWDGNFAEPTFNIEGGGSRFTDRQRSAYAAARLNPADGLTLILGVNHTAVSSSGESYGDSRGKAASRTSPTIGAVLDLGANVSAYASRTAIFLPQSEIDQQRNRLDPADGNNVELGLKSEWLDKKLQATLALFKARQNKLATYAGFDVDDGYSYYRGEDTRSRGFEFEVVGEPLPGWKLNAGVTQLQIKNAAGEVARTFTPRRVLRLASTWAVPALPGLKLGANLGLRSGVYRTIDGGPTLRQPGYALLDLMASYEIDAAWNVAVNLRNATDRKYLTSLYWDQGYYAAPRNGSVSLNWKF